MMSSLSLPAPAKLNLFLHILGKRSDGFHELQTLFQLLDFGDQLHFTPRTDNEIQLESNLAAVQPEQNLIVRAARALQSASGCDKGINIRLDKRLPLGGGIGGGSSDAATTLLALNTLWETGLSLRELSDLGRQLGADVPVFVQGRTAWAEGIGERLQPVDLAPQYYAVITPKCEVSTAGIFDHPELTRDSLAITVAAFFEQATRNDCQTLVERLYPEIAKCVKWLQNHPQNSAGNARMTGTGASIFAAFDSPEQADNIVSSCPWPGFVARGVNSSEVHHLLSIKT